MVRTFSEAYLQASFNGAHYVGVRPPKNTEKRQKPPKNIIFCPSVTFVYSDTDTKPFELQKWYRPFRKHIDEPVSMVPITLESDPQKTAKTAEKRHKNAEKRHFVVLPSVCHVRIYACWHQTVWAREMVQTFSEAYRRASFNGGQTPEKRRKMAKTAEKRHFFVQHVCP